MTRFLFLVVLLSTAQGVRMLKRGSSKIDFSSSSNTTNSCRGGCFPSAENAELTLETLGESAKTWHEDFAPRIITKIGELDWSVNLTGSLIALGAEAVGKLIGFVHPLLGAFFSFFVSLFGGGDTQLLKNIQKLIEKVVTVKLNNFLKEVVSWNIASVVDTIQLAGDDSALWKVFPLYVADSFSKVFVSCWLNPSSDECKKWRTKGSAGAGLMLELYFTDLMILSTATMASYGHDYEGLAALLLRAAERSKDHLDVFKECRLHGECRLVMGGWGRAGDGKCRDLLLNTVFCSDDKLSVNAYRRCFEDYEREVLHELSILEKHVVANFAAAYKIKGGAARTAHKQKTRICESSGRRLCWAGPLFGQCLDYSVCVDSNEKAYEECRSKGYGNDVSR